MTNISTRLFHFHDGVITENSKDENGRYIPEDGCQHLEELAVNGIPTYVRLISATEAEQPAPLQLLETVTI